MFSDKPEASAPAPTRTDGVRAENLAQIAAPPAGSSGSLAPLGIFVVR